MPNKRLGFDSHGVLEWIADPPNITAGAAAWDQQAYRVRDDAYGLNVDNGWLGNENADPAASIGVGTANQFRIRFCVDEYVSKVASVTPHLYFNREGGGWTKVSATSDYVRATSTTQYDDSTDTCSTRLLTAATPGNGAFETDGECDETDGSTAAHTLTAKGNYFETEFCVYLYDGGAGWTNGDTVEFAIFNTTSELDTYAGTSGAKGPTITASVSPAATTYTETTSLEAALLRQRILRTASADAALRRLAILNTTDLDALLVAHTHLTAELDAVLAAIIERTADLDAYIDVTSATYTRDTDIDSVIALALSLTTGLQPLIRKRVYVGIKADQTNITADDAINTADYRGGTPLDAVIVSDAPLTVLTDIDAALLRLGVQRTADLDAAIAAIATYTADLDAAIARAYLLSTDIDAALIATGTQTTDIDAAVQAVALLTAELDATIATAGQAATDLDAALSRVGMQTTDLDAAISALRTRTTDLDAAVRVSAQRTASVDAALLISRTATALADAVLRALETREVDIDAHLIVPGSIQLQALIDAALRATLTVQASADAALQARGIYQQALDAVVAAGQSTQADIDAALLATLERTTGLDARIIVEIAGTKITDLDAVLRKAFSVQTDLDSVLSLLAAATVNLDAALRTSGIRTADLDAHLIAIAAGTQITYLDAALRQAFSVSADIDARVELGAVLRTVLADLDAAVAEVGTVVTDIDAALRKTLTEQTDIDAALRDTFSVQTDLDGAAAVRFDRQLQIDTALARYGITGVSDIDAALKGLGVATQTALDARVSDLASETPGHRTRGIPRRNNRGNVHPHHRVRPVDDDGGQ